MVQNCDDTLSRFHLIPERNGQTDGRTDRQTDLLYQYRASACVSMLTRDNKQTNTAMSAASVSGLAMNS